jgi:RNA polymerase sigma-70 factor (sigma-E family)
VKRADEASYRAYVLAHMDGLRRYGYLLCHDWHTADDLVAVTLGKLYRNWAHARNAVHPDAYVRKILVRSWLDEKRRPWRRELLTSEVPDQPVADLTDTLDGTAALELLAGLTPRRRAAVVLRHYFDLSVDETAELLGCSAGTVRSLTARGLEAARAGDAVPATNGNGERP